MTIRIPWLNLGALWRRTRGAFNAAGEKLVGSVLARIIPTWRAGRPAPVEGDRVALARRYTSSSLIHACTVELATSAAEPDLVAIRDRQRLPDDDLVGQMAKSPNADQTPYEFTERIVTDLCGVFGEYFGQKLRSRAGIWRETWPLQVEHVEVIPRENGSIEKFEIGRGVAALRPEDVVHIKLPNPLNPYRGLSKVFVLWLEGNLDDDLLDHLGSFFANGAIPSAVLTSEQSLSGPQRELLREELEKQYDPSLGSSRHGWMVLSNGAKVEPFGVAPDRLAVDNVADIVEARICAVYGVPAVVVGAAVGLKQSQAYGTAREGRISMWEETLAPLYVRLSQALSKQIAMEFGSGYALRYDLSFVQPLQRAKSQIIRDTNILWLSGLLPRDRALERIGEEPVDGRPVYRHELDALAKSGDAQAFARLALAGQERISFERLHQLAGNRALGSAEQRRKYGLLERFPFPELQEYREAQAA